MRIKRTYRVLWFCLVSIICFAQGTMAAVQDSATVSMQDTVNRDAEDFVKAYVVVADPGSTLYAVYGHTCLRLVCDTYDMDYCFSYESENWNTQTLALLAGKLKMCMMAIPFEEYVALYAAEGRVVRQWELELPIAVKRELWRVLDEEIMRGELPFDLDKRGCTATCVDFLHRALDTIPIDYVWSDEYKGSVREISYNRCAKGWGTFWLMTIAGGKNDYTAIPNEQKIVVPIQLVETWQEATIQDKPFLSRDAEIVQPISRPQESPFTPLIASLCVLGLAIGSIFWKRPYIDWLILSIQTLFGLMLTYFVFFSNFPGTGWSWLILLFNLLPVIFWKWRVHWAVPYAIIIIIIIIIAAFMSRIWVMPAHLVLALAFCLTALKKNIRERKWL